MTVRHYRYRTPALTGPWRDSREAAVRDAAKARQAEIDESQPLGIKWAVPGQIEELANEGASRAKG